MKGNERAQQSQMEDQVVSQRQHRLEAKIDSVSLDHVNMAQEVDARSERSTAIDDTFDRLEAKIDAHFNRQTVLMTVLGVLTLFGDTIRGLLGL